MLFCKMLLIGVLAFSFGFQVFGANVPDSATLKRDPILGISIANFECHKYQKLSPSVGELYGGKTTKVDSSLDCGFVCTKLNRCFSFNFGITPDVNGKHICEVLSTDKYNSSEQLRPSLNSHHFSIMSPCSTSPCLNGGRCIALYDKDDFKCACTNRFAGRRCETIKYHEIYIKAFGNDDNGLSLKTSIRVNGVEHSVMSRGHNIVVVNMDGTVESSVSYDSYGDSSAASRMKQFIDNIATGRIVLIATQDSAEHHYNQAALTSVGATATPLKHRESWYLIGYKGDPKPWIQQGHKAAGKGPATANVMIPT